MQETSLERSTRPAKSAPAVGKARLGGLWLASTLCLTGLVVCLVWWPGLPTLDASGQLGQYIGGHYLDWQSPELSVLWGWMFSLFGYPKGPFLLDTALTLAAVGLWVVLLPLGWLWRCVVAAAVVIWPPILLQLGPVTRDVPFAAASLLAVALVIHARRRTLGRRWPWVVATLLSFLAVVSFREEGVISLLPAAAVLVSLVPSHWTGERSRLHGRLQRTLVVGFAAAIVAVVTLGVSSVIGHRVIRAKATYPYQFDMLWDLASVSVTSGRNLIPPAFQDHATLGFLRSHTYDVVGDPLFWPGPNPSGRVEKISFSYDAHDINVLEHDWLRALADHPSTFLRVRFGLADWDLSIAHPPPFALVEPLNFGATRGSGCLRYVHTPCGVLTSAGARSLETLGTSDKGWLIFRQWPYSLASLAVLVLSLWRKRGRSLLAVLLAASGLIETAVLIALGTDTVVYRFHEWPMLAAVTAVITYGCAQLATLRRTSAHEPRPDLEPNAPAGESDEPARSHALTKV